MFKLLWRLIGIALIALIAFLVLSLTSGGEKFRWFGKKVERESERVGDRADELKQKSEKVMKGIEKTKETFEGLTGRRNDKSR